MSDVEESTSGAVCTLDGVCIEPEAEAKTTDVSLPKSEDRQSSDEPPSTSELSKGKGHSNKLPRRKKKGGGNSSSSNNSIIKNVHTQHELDTLVHSQEAVIVEYMTSWCGACKGIAPYYEELAQNADVVVSAQVLCDKNKETKKLATAQGVSSYPVFVLYQDGSSVGRWNGADRGKLEKAFERLNGGGGGKKKNRKR